MAAGVPSLTYLLQNLCIQVATGLELGFCERKDWHPQSRHYTLPVLAGRNV